jgi:hypothetical protein
MHGGEALADWRATAERVRRHPQVEAIAPFVAAEVLVARGDEMRGVVVRGILPAAEEGVTEIAAGAGPCCPGSRPTAATSSSASSWPRRCASRRATRSA